MHTRQGARAEPRPRACEYTHGHANGYAHAQANALALAQTHMDTPTGLRMPTHMHSQKTHTNTPTWMKIPTHMYSQKRTRTRQGCTRTRQDCTRRAAHYAKHAQEPSVVPRVKINEVRTAFDGEETFMGEKRLENGL